MIIRKTQQADLCSITALDLLLQDNSAWTLKQFEEAYKEQSFNYVIEQEHTQDVIGYVFSQYVLDEAEIHIIGVNPELHRQGLATKLLEYLIQDLQREDIKNLFLEVRESNQAAIYLYKKLGFLKVGQRKNYYKKYVISNGEEKQFFEDALIMKRVL